jgi:hypothetical protein
MVDSRLVRRSFARREPSPKEEHHMNGLTKAFAAGLLGIGVSLGIAASLAPAGAQSAKALVGTLICKGGPSVGLIVGSTQPMVCTFKPEGHHRSRDYRATMTKVGLDIGFKNETTIVWQVLGSTDVYKGGLLVGDYGGVSAEASVALGVGANALVGGSGKSVVLQPLSVQGQTGLNLAVGVTSLVLHRR